MTANVAHLPHRWRERAASLDRYAPGAGVAFREAAHELELALDSADCATSEAIERVETFVLTQLGADSRRLTTSELRTAARGRRISNAILARALKTLSSRGDIAFESGARGAKRWHLVRSTQ